MVEQESTHVEEWRPVVGCSGLYSVSSNGRVRRESKACGATAGAIIGSECSTSGYCYAVLCRSKTDHKSRAVHQLVLEAFKGPCPDGQECRHMDGIRNNNHIGNLQWGTKVENQRDRLVHGTHTRGTNNGFSKLTDSDVRAIRSLRESRHWTLKRLATAFVINKEVISGILSGKYWSHVC